MQGDKTFEEWVKELGKRKSGNYTDYSDPSNVFNCIDTFTKSRRNGNNERFIRVCWCEKNPQWSEEAERIIRDLANGGLSIKIPTRVLAHVEHFPFSEQGLMAAKKYAKNISQLKTNELYTEQKK